MHKINSQINPVILIPMHKQEPSPLEKLSLIQCQKILGSYPIYLLHPQGMSTRIYEAIFPTLRTLTAPPNSMSSISAYNKLMIAPFIYKALNSHSHILIHEPDTIVLKNDLHYWCEQDFDYISAPWFSSDAMEDLQLKATGNFGLSLIKTKNINTLFTDNPRWFSASMIVRELIRGLGGKKDAFSRAIKSMGSSGRLSGAHHIYEDHCDIFWSYLAPKVAPHLRIAPPEQAIYFSWEQSPKKCLSLCNGKLPFGIHGWPKHDLTFLGPLLLKSGAIPNTPYSV